MLRFLIGVGTKVVRFLSCNVCMVVLLVLGQQPMLEQGEVDLVTAVENVQIDFGIRVPGDQFVVKRNALGDRDNGISLSVENLGVGQSNAVDISDRGTLGHFFLTVHAAGGYVVGVTFVLLCPQMQIGNGYESRNGLKIGRAEACHQQSHMSAAAAAEKEQIFRIHIVMRDHIVNGIFNILLGKVRAAGFGAVGRGV